MVLHQIRPPQRDSKQSDKVLEATGFAFEPYGDKIRFPASIRELLSNFAFLLGV